MQRGSLSLVSTTEELLGSNSSGFGLESREYGRRDSSHWPRGILYPQMLALTSLTGSGRSVGIGRLQTEAIVFFLCRGYVMRISFHYEKFHRLHVEEMDFGLRWSMACEDMSPRAEALSPLEDVTKQRIEHCDLEHKSLRVWLKCVKCSHQLHACPINHITDSNYTCNYSNTWQYQNMNC
jgi:hypothetical protein